MNPVCSEQRGMSDKYSVCSPGSKRQRSNLELIALFKKAEAVPMMSKINQPGKTAALQQMSMRLLRRNFMIDQIFLRIKRQRVEIGRKLWTALNPGKRTANQVNDTYLRTSGEDAGLASYNQVCDLLVYWHIETVVLPSISEEESHFDPYDESQVDLSDIVNAR